MRFAAFISPCDILQQPSSLLVKRVNKFLNRGLKIMTNEQDSVRIEEEANLLLIYARNSAPVAGTDLSYSLVPVGREFHFPINFSASSTSSWYLHHLLFGLMRRIKLEYCLLAMNLSIVNWLMHLVLIHVSITWAMLSYELCGL